MIILNKYKILENLGRGEFGAVYKGENIRTKEAVVVKMEPTSSTMLKREAQIYQFLGKFDGIPSLKWYGKIDAFNYIVLPLYSFSLNNIPSSNTISPVSIFQMGRKMIEILEYIHGKGLVHRDVKPDNFCIDSSTQKLYIIDFGLCKKYVGVEMRTGRSMLGTPNYVSLNVHDGVEPSRRDDLESIGYILIKLIYGGLEWEKELDLQKMRQMKMLLVTDSRLQKYIEIVRDLEFDETPNYDLLKSIL